MRVNFETRSCTKTQSVEMSPTPASTTTVGEPAPAQSKCILWPPMETSSPGAVGLSGLVCAPAKNEKTEISKQVRTARTHGMRSKFLQFEGRKRGEEVSNFC